MKSASTINPTEQFGLLIQGPPKTGKTELAALFPRPWIANADGNLSGFARRCQTQDFKTDMVYSDLFMDDTGKKLIKADTSIDWKNVYARFINETGAAIVSKDIDTIVFDSATTLSMIIMSFIMIDRVARTGKGKEDISEIQDWNTHQNLWKTLIMRIRGSGKMFITIAHEEGMTDEISGGVIKWAPNLPGKKLQSAFGGFFSDVWRTEVEDYRPANATVATTRYLVRTKPTARLDLGGSVTTPDATFIRPTGLKEQQEFLHTLLQYKKPVASA